MLKLKHLDGAMRQERLQAAYPAPADRPAAPVCRVCKGRRLIDGPSGHPEDATNCPACEDDEASQLADRAAAHPMPGVPRAHHEGSFGQRLADARRRLIAETLDDEPAVIGAGCGRPTA